MSANAICPEAVFEAVHFLKANFTIGHNRSKHNASKYESFCTSSKLLYSSYIDTTRSEINIIKFLLNMTLAFKKDAKTNVLDRLSNTHGFKNKNNFGKACKACGSQ